MERGASSGEIREELVTNGPEIPPVELDSPPVSALPPLEQGQRTRQPPAYLKDFIGDCVRIGKHVSLAGCSKKKLSVDCGSCTTAGKSKSDFYEGGVVGEINPPKAKHSLFVCLFYFVIVGKKLIEKKIYKMTGPMAQ